MFLRDKFKQWNPTYGIRFGIVCGVLLLYVGFICLCSFNTMIVHGDKYRGLVKNLKKDSISIQQIRGVIYSETGDMIAASLPQYDVYFDFRTKDKEMPKRIYDSIEHKKRTIMVKLLPSDTVAHYFAPNGPAAQYMHKLAPHRSAADHAAAFRNAYKQGKGRYLAFRAVSYLDFKEMKKSAPFFSKNPNHIGLIGEERPHRYRPYGEYRMASSTIGGVFPADTIRTNEEGQKVNMKGHGRNGLESTFDKYLSGREGIGFIQKVKSRRITIVQQEPEDGADVYTTLDMEMQMILDYELNKRILELNAAGGWAAVMEVKTGKIKAISNLKRFGDRCSEDYNHFVTDIYDPGSTFKTVSYMILLDDEKITPETRVNTGNTAEHPSSWNYHGKEIRDDHPVGEVTADEAMVQSSNISLAKLTTGAYEKNPQRYLDLIDKTKIFEDLNLNEEFYGAQRPRQRKVGDKTWSKVSLGQISYGYETQIPGMYILNFYNAIANDGKLMKPYIVDKIVKEGETIVEYEPEVINSSICKSSTIKAIRHALEGVVEHGTAETKWYADGRTLREGAKSKKLKIAGKTGTAQRFANGSYSGNGHYVSFAGYFPADEPQYTCVVVIDARPGGNFGRPGGGYMAGPVFRNFAEQVYARSCSRKLKEVEPDSINVANHGMLPKAKRGPVGMTSEVIDELNLGKQRDMLRFQEADLGSAKPGRVPDVHGMGAADALYMLESAGLRVSVYGKGAVVSQSMPAGSNCSRGQTISITLK